MKYKMLVLRMWLLADFGIQATTKTLVENLHSSLYLDTHADGYLYLLLQRRIY